MLRHHFYRSVLPDRILRRARSASGWLHRTIHGMVAITPRPISAIGELAVGSHIRTSDTGSLFGEENRVIGDFLFSRFAPPVDIADEAGLAAHAGRPVILPVVPSTATVGLVAEYPAVQAHKPCSDPTSRRGRRLNDAVTFKICNAA